MGNSNQPGRTRVKIIMYSKTCRKLPPPKIDKINALKTYGILMKVESVEECSLGVFCNTPGLN